MAHRVTRVVTPIPSRGTPCFRQAQVAVVMWWTKGVFFTDTALRVWEVGLVAALLQWSKRNFGSDKSYRDIDPIRIHGSVWLIEAWVTVQCKLMEGTTNIQFYSTDGGEQKNNNIETMDYDIISHTTLLFASIFVLPKISRQEKRGRGLAKYLRLHVPMITSCCSCCMVMMATTAEGRIQ